MKHKDLRNYYSFHVLLGMVIALLAAGCWMYVWLQPPTPGSAKAALSGAIVATLLLPWALQRQVKFHRRHARKVLFMLDAIENNDYAIRFSENEENKEEKLVNSALNRVVRTLSNVKSETAQQEKYYEIILDCVNTGILVLNDNGAVYQKNSEALRLLGLNVFTHVRQLERVDKRLMELIAHCRPGEKLQVAFSNERGVVNLSIRISNIVIRDEHLRILALNDINNELDEKEIDSWIRLTRVLTHEIMNAVTPITSLSDTLLKLANGEQTKPANEAVGMDEICSGLSTISTTGKGLLSFIESYRRFTRIPTPEPSLFYVKEFVNRMTDLARHQYPEARINFRTDISHDDLILYADENLVSQVMINLLKNAIQAIESEAAENSTKADSKETAPQENCICIRAYCNEAEAVLIEVSNNGPAIAPQIAEHIFIPFFTTKQGGSGIGLSISRQIMRLSGGSISLLRSPETTFVLKFN